MLLVCLNITTIIYETYLPFSCSPVAALPGTNAVWIFPIGAICGDGGIWLDGISILSKSENNSDVGVWHFGITVSTNIQDIIR